MFTPGTALLDLPAVGEDEYLSSRDPTKGSGAMGHPQAPLEKVPA